MRTRNSIRGFVRPLVRPSVRWSVVIELKSGKISVLEAFCVCVCVLERGIGGALGVDERLLPLPTRPQRYCDPASLVFSRGHATLHLAVSVGRSVGRSVGPSVTFLNSERFLHYCSCPTVRDWIAVYPALFKSEHPEKMFFFLCGALIKHF